MAKVDSTRSSDILCYIATTIEFSTWNNTTVQIYRKLQDFRVKGHLVSKVSPAYNKEENDYLTSNPQMEGLIKSQTETVWWLQLANKLTNALPYGTDPHSVSSLLLCVFLVQALLHKPLGQFE